MKGPSLGPGEEDITWPDQVAPRSRMASSTRKIKPQSSNLNLPTVALKSVSKILCLLCRSRSYPPSCWNLSVLDGAALMLLCRPFPPIAEDT